MPAATTGKFTITPMALLKMLLHLLMSVMFIYSALTKIVDIAAFYKTLAAYKLFSLNILPFLAYYVPILEIFLGIILLIPQTAKAALKSALLVLLVFSGALLSLQIRGLSVDCGCLGSFGSTPGWALLRNLFIILIVSWLLFLKSSQKITEIVNK